MNEADVCYTVILPRPMKLVELNTILKKLKQNGDFTMRLVDDDERMKVRDTVWAYSPVITLKVSSADALIKIGVQPSETVQYFLPNDLYTSLTLVFLGKHPDYDANNINLIVKACADDLKQLL